MARAENEVLHYRLHEAGMVRAKQTALLRACEALVSYKPRIAVGSSAEMERQTKIETPEASMAEG
jgi:hypothetical protein